MANIAIFYGSSTGNTEKVAEKIKHAFGGDAITLNVDDARDKDLVKFPYLIFGTSTWEIGDMQDDWQEFIDIVDKVDLSRKKVALFGLGDQEIYPNCFADGVGRIYDHITGKTTVVGKWPVDGYDFEESDAVRDGEFVGLILDEDNQSKLTNERIQKWVEMLRKEFV